MRRIPSKCLRLMCSASHAGSSSAHSQGSKARDPAPVFLNTEVQRLLYKVTGFNLDRIFPRRYVEAPGPPKYKLLTDQQLEEIEKEAIAKGKHYIQMPPVMTARDETPEILSEDPEIEGFSQHSHVFTDITFGLPHRERAIVVREPGGDLRHCTPSERDHILQVYYQRTGRMLHMPDMFKDENLERILGEGRYEYVLDRACVQFEPDEPNYIRVTQRTYEHLAEHGQFDLLRSTRYFGTMTFYFVFYKKIEALLVDMVQRDRLDDAADVVRLHHIVHPESKSAKTVQEQNITDPQLIIQEFVKLDARHGGIVELALQTLSETKAEESVYS